MKKIILFLMLSVVLLPSAFAKDYKESKVSTNGTCLISSKSGNLTADCSTYLKNFPYLLKPWHSKVNDVLKKKIEDLIGNVL